MMQEQQQKTYKLPDNNVCISFSGGRTSAFMLYHILEANNGLPDNALVCFQNTGREMPQTLDFVNNCSQKWNVKITWLEYDLNEENKHIFKIVRYDNASRKGEPFDKLINKHNRLPNPMSRFCTGSLKRDTTSKYLRSLGWKKWHNALGIRSDEKHRCKPGFANGFYPFYPICEANHNIFDVDKFWDKQDFKLDLPVVNGKTIKGNCDLCFLKSESQLASMVRDHPELAKWWIDAEERTGRQFERGRNLKRFAEFVDRQQDWIFNDEAYLCQADGGDCTG
jgi:hypothetical protein